jgi:hypothetical protein
VVIGTYSEGAFDEPVVNGSGQVGVRVATIDTRGTTVQPFGQHMLVLNLDGSYTNLLSYGDPGPEGWTIGSLSMPVLNDSGTIAFGSYATPPGGGLTKALWRKSAEQTPELIVREDAETPGMPGVTFDNVYYDHNAEMPLWINNRGEVAFWANLVGEPIGSGFAESAWIGSPEEGLRPLLIERQEAPGTGGVFASMTSTIGDMIREMTVNNNSQAAVLAYFEFVPGERHDGLFATDVHGNLRKIVAYGDILEVAPDDLRQVLYVNFQGDQHQRCATGLNDRGEVAFSVQFTDGTWGVFISSLVAIPEPPSHVLMVTASLIGAVLGAVRRPTAD